MVGFNQGVKDRLKPKMNAMNTTSADDNEDIQLENLLTNLTPIYEFIQEMGGTEADFDFNEASKYEGALRDIIAIFRALSKNPIKFKAIIPTKLSLEIDGISNLIIGHMFNIHPDLLPRGYKTDADTGVGRKLGYILTGVGHTVNDSGWVTKLEGQTIILEEPDGKETDLFEVTLDKTGKVTGATANITTGKGGNLVGGLKQPYTDKNLNKGWEGKQVAFNSTVINPAVEGPKLSKKYGKTLAQAILATVQIEQNFKGFNWNLGGFDITAGGWKFDASIHDGYVVAKEGGTGLFKAFISFKDFDSFISQKVASFKRKGFESATTAEAFGKLWYEKWNGYGARVLKPSNISTADWDAIKIKDAGSVWNKNAKYV